ncbi:MAG: hypothetical protein GX245_01440 [Eubacteriaceae bacterium]|nr:hypothetical protein [Eubacteriaceae bacterium]
MINNLLDAFCANYKIAPNNDQNQKRATAFELLSCVVAFDVSPYYAKDNCWNAQYVDKNHSYVCNTKDGGIDGYHIVEESGQNKKIIIKLIQSKYSNSVSSKDIEKFFRSIHTYIVPRTNNLPLEYASLKNIINKISETKKNAPTAIISYEVYICLCDISDQQRKNLEDIFTHEFEGSDSFTLHFIVKKDFEKKIKIIKQNIIDENFKDSCINLQLAVKSHVHEAKDSTQNKVLATILNGKQVHKMIKDESKSNFELSRLFSGNVRGFLEETDVNLQMKHTIEHSAPSFLNKNNGIVVVCDEMNLDPNGIDLIITNPIIVNGQQTVSSIYLYAKEDDKQRAVYIQAKFIEIKNDDYNAKQETLLDIAKASNDSNKVSDLDLLSNRKLFKNLKKSFSNQGKFLKIKKGEILNDVFFGNSDNIDFVEILKIWVTIYLKRPADAKKTIQNIQIFTKAYDKNRKDSYTLLAEERNYILIQNMFLESSKIAEYKDSVVKDFFGKEAYYDHAQYFILYLLNEETSGNIINSNNNFSRIKTLIENLIAEEKKNKEINEQEFTFNNYFKSHKPQADYLKLKGDGKNVESVDTMLKMIFSNKTDM